MQGIKMKRPSEEWKTESELLKKYSKAGKSMSAE